MTLRGANANLCQQLVVMIAIVGGAWGLRKSFLVRLATLLAIVSIAIPLGCGSPRTVCTVTPIDIEETKSDIKDLHADLELARQRLARVQGELAAWQKRYDESKDKPMELRAELERLKKASGRTEKPEEGQVEGRRTEAASTNG